MAALDVYERVPIRNITVVENRNLSFESDQVYHRLNIRTDIVVKNVAGDVQMIVRWCVVVVVLILNS